MEIGNPSAGFNEPFRRVEREELAVVGGGIIGVSTAYAAAIKGRGRVKVSLYETSEVGHQGAASSDVNRVFRYLNGPDPLLTIWAKEARSWWEHLGRRTGSPVLHPTGVVFLVETGDGVQTTGGHVSPYENADGWLKDALRVMDEQDVPYRRMGPRQLGEMYPQFHSPAVEEAVLDPGAGFVEASKALSAMLDLCLRAGVEYHSGARVTGVEATGGGCLLYTEDGAETRAEAVVVAANGWTGEILPQRPGALTLTEQPLVYLTPPEGAPELVLGRMPVFISLTSDCYGFPVHGGILKVADDTPHRTIDHPDQRREPGEEYLRRVVSTVSGFIPAIRGAAVERTHVCFYDRSEDGRFILDAWDRDARIIYGCGMSGRAFKFGPVIGERLARFAISGERPKDLEGFRAR